MVAMVNIKFLISWWPGCQNKKFVAQDQNCKIKLKKKVIEHLNFLKINTKKSAQNKYEINEEIALTTHKAELKAVSSININTVNSYL